jgi:hypothetical protein
VISQLGTGKLHFLQCSEIPAGDGIIVNLFLQRRVFLFRIFYISEELFTLEGKPSKICISGLYNSQVQYSNILTLLPQV